MRLERPRRPTTGRLRSGLASKIPSRIHRGHDRSSRRPLLSDDAGAPWLDSGVEEVDDVTEIAPGFSPDWRWKAPSSRAMAKSPLSKSPRTPTMATAHVKKVLSAVTSLPKRGHERHARNAYSPKDLYDDDDVESRDDESRCLLHSAHDEFARQRMHFFPRDDATVDMDELTADPVVDFDAEPAVVEESPVESLFVDDGPRHEHRQQIQQIQPCVEDCPSVSSVRSLPHDSPSVSSMRSFKQLLHHADSGDLRVVDLGGVDAEGNEVETDAAASVGSSSDKENAGAETSGKSQPNVAFSPALRASTDSLRYSEVSDLLPARMNSITSDLAGMNIGGLSPSTLASSAHRSSIESSPSDETSQDGSAEAADLGSNLSVIGVGAKAPASQHAKLYQTPVESVATESRESLVTYATSYMQARHGPCPVSITPTENGDVILMTPMEDVMDVGPQPKSAGPKQALMIPSLSPGNLEDAKVNLEPAQTPATRSNKVGFLHEASPTGVDDLFASEDEFTEVTFGASSKLSISKPPLAPAREDSEFIASEDWSVDEGEIGSVGSSPSREAFGSCTVHDDAFRNLVTERANRHIIELRHDLESDCGASSSVVSSSVVSGSSASDKGTTQRVQGRSLLDVVVDEEQEEQSKGDKETGAILGSFSQIFARDSGVVSHEEDSDSESDAPGDYFDFGHEDKEGLAVEEAPSGSRGETPAYARQSSTTSLKSRPWAKIVEADDDSASDYVGSDLVSAPSTSSSSNTSLLSSSAPHIVARETSGGSTGSFNGTSASNEDQDPSQMNDFDKLNNYWVHEWAEMATTTADVETPKAKEMSDPDTDQPRFLRKKDVGNAMDDEDEMDEPQSSVVCMDCDGNEYIKIYDLDSGMDIYEVLQRSTELETVEECSSEEEEATVEENSEYGGTKHLQASEEVAQPQPKELDALWSKIDEYQATIRHDQTTQLLSPSGLELRSVRSSRKRCVRVKKRAITKARASAKAKYDLAYLEEGSFHEEGSHQEKRCHSRSLSRERLELSKSGSGTDAPLEDMITQALGTLEGKESDATKKDDGHIQFLRQNSMNNTDLFLIRSMKDKDLKLLQDSIDTSEEGEDSGSFGLRESHSSWDMSGVAEKGGALEQPTGSRSEETAAAKPPRRELERGSSFMLTKLYGDNMELAENLAATQSELEKVTRQLERALAERDDVIANARFEI